MTEARIIYPDDARTDLVDAITDCLHVLQGDVEALVALESEVLDTALGHYAAEVAECEGPCPIVEHRDA